MNIKSTLRHNKLLLLFVVAILIYFGYLAYTFGGLHTPRVNGPGILFQSTGYDAGSIKAATTGSFHYRFHFENNGNEPLIIDKIKTDCGCSAAEADKNIYAPGEKGIIDVDLDLITLGRRRSNILIQSNAATSPDVIWIAASFEPTITTRPESHQVRFNKIKIGDNITKTLTINIFHMDPLEVTVDNIYSTHKSIEAKLNRSTKSIFRNQVGYLFTSFYFDVTVQAEKPGEIGGKLRMTFTSSQEVPDVEIPVAAHIVPEFTHSPQKAIFILSSAQHENFASRKIELYHANHGTFIYHKIDNPFAHWLDVQVKVAEDRKKVILNLNPLKVPAERSVQGDIIVYLEDETGAIKEVHIPVRAKVI